MAHGLNIKKTGALDFLSLGALVHRLDPGMTPFRKATHCDIHVSGGEFNCAANLSDCFQLKAGIATAMVGYPIGELIAERVRAMGVKPFYKHFQHDGVHGPNMATVYSDRGQGVRAPVVFYNRCNEAAAQLKPGDFKWKEIFAGGVRWFHSGGIFAALSETTAEVIIEGMKAAKRAGAVTSFDLNYRAKLWNIVGGHDRAVKVLDRIVKHVDVLVGNEEDLQLGLGIPGPEVHAESKLGPSAFFSMMGNVTRKHPHVKVVATTMREVHSTNRHSWGAVAWINGQTFTSPTCELDVIDRVGGGDGYAAGFFYGLLSGESPQAAVNLGWAHGALLTTFPGDTTMATVDQVRAFAKGGSRPDSKVKPTGFAGVFATTHWSVVVRAGDSRSPEADSAMERLCQTYWYPLYVFVRRKGHGHEDASDLTQAFFARFLEKHYLRSVDSSLGKFRTFLLTSMTHFLANEWDKSQAQRRGGGVRMLSLDEAAAEQRYQVEPVDHATPETLFERRWAQTVMGVVLDRLAAEMDEKRFEVLKGFLLEEKGAVSYDEASSQLELSVSAITSAIHRMRGRFRALLFEEVANTVDKPEEVERELRHLLAALSD